MFDTLDRPAGGADVTLATSVFDHSIVSMPRPDTLPELSAGKVWGLSGALGSGLTRLAMSLLAQQAHLGQVAVLETRGWFSPLAAWEAGIPADQLVVVRAPDPVRWARAAATLVEGVHVLYGEVPDRINDTALRKLGALVRRNGTRVLLRSFAKPLPAGVAQLRIEAGVAEWEGADAGHGTLVRRRFDIELTGKAVGGALRRIELEDDGANTVRVVPRLAVAEIGRAIG